MAALLEVSDLNKHFGGLHAVKNVSLAVERGEVVGILGPNGAGKTTVYNLLTGFIAPDPGARIVFQGQSVLGLAPYRIAALGISRTFQLCRPFVGLSVLENVVVGALGAKASKGADLETRARLLLAQVGLSGKEGVAVEVLSYGDQRRLEIARALAAKPALLLLDEPFAGLGSAEIADLSALIRKVHADEGLTVVLIEHKLREFMRLVDRVVALDFGEIIATGLPDDIVRHPAVIEAYIGRDNDVSPAASSHAA